MDAQIIATFFGFTLTAVGLFNSLIFSRFNELMRERRSAIFRQISQCRELLRDREVHRIILYEQRRKLLEQNLHFLEEYQTSLKYIPIEINMWGLISLFCYLISFVILLLKDAFLIMNKICVMSFIIGLFSTGIIFLVRYILIFYRYIKNYLDMYKIKDPEGKLSFIEINGEVIDIGIKEIRRSFDDLPSRLVVKVRIEGNFYNGFLDSHYRYYSSIHRRFELLWIPDPITYLSQFWYQGPTLQIQKMGLDTGILQDNIHEEVTLEFILREDSCAHAEYRLRQGDQIERIEIDIFEDLWHLPNTERRNITKEKLTIYNENFYVHNHQ